MQMMAELTEAAIFTDDVEVCQEEATQRPDNTDVRNYYRGLACLGLQKI